MWISCLGSLCFCGGIALSFTLMRVVSSEVCLNNFVGITCRQESYSDFRFNVRMLHIKLVFLGRLEAREQQLLLLHGEKFPLSQYFINKWTVQRAATMLLCSASHSCSPEFDIRSRLYCQYTQLIKLGNRKFFSSATCWSAVTCMKVQNTFHNTCEIWYLRIPECDMLRDLVGRLK